MSDLEQRLRANADAMEDAGYDRSYVELERDAAGAVEALKKIARYPRSTRITSGYHCDRETMINIARTALKGTTDVD